MSKPAAIQASYADYRRVKGRKVLQLIFEVPLEQAPAVHDVFGEPMPDGSTWVGIARIGPGAKTGPAKADRPKRQWSNLSRAEQAGIACNEKGFWTFLKEKFGQKIASVDDAAASVRHLCEVKSRAEFDTSETAAMHWDGLYEGYAVWLRAPEVVG